jgi:hypothetical protein
MLSHHRQRTFLEVAAAVVFAASCGGEVSTAAQVVGAAHSTRLPDNPCDLLSASAVAMATGLDVSAASRVRSIADTNGNRSICLYSTQSDFGALLIGYYPPELPPDERRRCDERTVSARSLAEHYRGGGLIVCVAPNTPISVSMQNAIGAGHLNVLVNLAQAVLDRTADTQ